MMSIHTGIRSHVRRALDVKDLLVPLIEEPAEGVFTFDLFHHAYCADLLDEVAKHEPKEPPNSMNRYGLVLDEAGMGSICQILLTKVVNPLVRRVYPRLGPLKSYHGFIVSYDPKKQGSLDLHRDDSLVTLNVCLGHTFTGGRLVFRYDDGGIATKIDHRIGRAVLHLGEQLHEAQKIRTGTRSNLILWCRQ
jgi:hypothetical protein